MHITLNGCQFFFDVYGSKLRILPDRIEEKPTLIVLHGAHGMLDHTLYVEFWSQMSDVAQVIFLDQRGCGRSDPRDASEWNLHQWAVDLHDFCQQLQITKPIIAGISMGGHVLCDYIKHYPKEAGALIFCNTEARFILDDVCTILEQRAGAEIAELARKQFTNPTAEITKEYQKRCIPFYGRNTYTPLDISRCKQQTAVFNHFTRHEMTAFNYLEDIQKICCPTLLMVGEESPFHPPVRAYEMLERIPKGLGELHLFKNAGAAVYKDSPAEALEVVRTFIQTYQHTS